MDGIARNTSGLDVGLADALGPVLVAALALLVGLLAAAVVVEVLRRGPHAPGFVRTVEPILPRPARRAAAVVVSLAVGLLAPAPAFASDAPVRDWLSGSTTTTTTAPGPLPTGPVATEDGLAARRGASATTTPTTPPPLEPVAPAPVPPVPSAPERASAVHVVVPGDCLWAIAAAHLAPDATNAEIDVAWRAIYTANVAAIGDDPNLVFPGLELELPPFDPPRAAP